MSSPEERCLNVFLFGPTTKSRRCSTIRLFNGSCGLAPQSRGTWQLAHLLSMLVDIRSMCGKQGFCTRGAVAPKRWSPVRCTGTCTLKAASTHGLVPFAVLYRHLMPAGPFFGGAACLASSFGSDTCEAGEKRTSSEKMLLSA